MTITREKISGIIGTAIFAVLLLLLLVGDALAVWTYRRAADWGLLRRLLVPGFPLINAVSDMVKGYFNMGLARWGTATLLTISAAIGIILAMSVTGIWGWKV